jgi:acetylglutamate kinase
MKQYIDKAAVLIEALPYIQDFRDSIVVVKVGGSVMESQENLERLLTDIAFMNTVGIKTVLVHGGGKAISREMEKEGIAPHFVQGLRVTCERTIRVVERVLKREVNTNVVRILQAHGVSARPLHGDWIFRCAKKTGKDAEGNALDWGFVGSPIAVDGRAVVEMLNAGMLPVVTPLGADADGAVHNMNADTAASAPAMAVRARKRAFISDVPGLLRDVDDPESRITALRANGVEALKAAGIAGGGMLPKLDSCVEAIRAGVGKVHLVDGRMPHSLLLEIFTKTGVGTEIVADD